MSPPPSRWAGPPRRRSGLAHFRRERKVGRLRFADNEECNGRIQGEVLMVLDL
jgi:hypothetical protein